MTFAERQFARAIARIGESKTEKLRNDHRLAERTPIRIPVAVKLDLDAKTGWTGARMHDISAHGTRLEIPSAMAIGASFLLRLPSKDGKQPAQPLLCRVVHCLPTKNNSFVIVPNSWATRRYENPPGTTPRKRAASSIRSSIDHFCGFRTTNPTNRDGISLRLDLTSSRPNPFR